MLGLGVGGIAQEDLLVGLECTVILLGVVQPSAKGKEGLGGLAGGGDSGDGRLGPGLEPERAATEGDETRGEDKMTPGGNSRVSSAVRTCDWRSPGQSVSSKGKAGGSKTQGRRSVDRRPCSRC